MYLALFNVYFDVSKKAEYEHLTKPIFETEIDLFLFQWSDSKNYTLMDAGVSYLPSSILAYKNDPENWMFTDDFAEQRQQHGHCFAQKVLGIIPKGTRLKVVKIKKNPYTGRIKGYFARLENDQFAKYLVDIGSLLEPRFTTFDQVPKMGKGYLKQSVQHAGMVNH